MGKFIDLTGKRFGKLIVVKRKDAQNKKIIWLCLCECGEEKEARGSDLKKSKVVSCGCIRRKNTYKIDGNIILGTTLEGDNFKVDLEDYKRVKKHGWYKNPEGYFYAFINKKTISLQRFITKVDSEYKVDHRDHDLANNTKHNLRICTNTESARNRGLFKNNTSGITGVIWNKKNKNWISRITVNYEKIYLGSFINKDDAIKARKDAEELYFGNFSFDNSMKEQKG